MADDALEKKRVGEVFKYFQAASHAIGPGDDDIDSKQGSEPALEHVSLDPVLNALCQLGACRLDCDRAFISLIDHETQYIVSEMTKSVSLYDTSRHLAGDMICLGARPFDLDAGVCAGTMLAFTTPVPNPHHVNTPNIFADGTRYIINDFSLEPKYKDRPYVTGFPYFRYYAEVPIRSSRGYVIGTYAVIHSKPKQGLDEQSFLALQEIASSIMRHIELIKVQNDYAQSSRMLQGLNSLVQDSHQRTTLPGSEALTGLDTQTKDLLLDPEPRPRTAPETNQVDSTMVLAQPTHDPLTSDSSSTTVNQSMPGTAATSQARSILNKESSTQDAPQVSEHISLEARDQKLNHAKPVADPGEFGMSGEIRSNLDVAAQTLRVAMDLDSVLFLDASPIRMTSRDRASLASSQSTGDSSERMRDGSSNEAQTRRASYSLSLLQDSVETPGPGVGVSATRGANSKLLGASARTSRTSTENAISPSVYDVSETLHQNLLLRYPRGCIFNIELGELLEDTFAAYSASDFAERGLHFGHQTLSQQEILDQTHLAFPKAKSVIFLPLWNTTKRGWFAGCLGWSSHDKRVLQSEDLAYFKVFGNSLMAKAARLDLIATDHAKSDFISNISHELRSPLHGILGSTELLRELVQDTDQQQMIAMVEQCGRTLLDTMNHVLEYSKINSMTRDDQDQRVSNTPGSVPRPKAFLGNLSTFDLSSLVEEVVETLVAGHQHSSRAQTPGCSPFAEDSPFSRGMHGGQHPSQSPIVILGVEHRDTWFIDSDSASWRRCIMNLLGNALKYTDVGFIEVMLRSNGQSPKTPDAVRLSVRDTGRGIGKAYLENHLFRPFVQEDALSSTGIGLGLSIVKSLVDAMGGWLEVQSEVGIGTQVEISIPVNFIPMSIGTDQLPPVQQIGLQVSLCGFEISTFNQGSQSRVLSTSQKRRLALKRAISTHLGDWLKMKITSSTRAHRSAADIIVVEEDELCLFTSANADQPGSFQLPPNSILLVLCTQHSIQHHSISSNSAQVYYLSQPFGPRRLASLISRLSQSRKTEELMPEPVLRLPHRLPQEVSPSQATTSLLPEGQKTGPMPFITEISNASPRSAAPVVRLPHVLLVDDNDINLILLTRCMQRLKTQYRTASNGAEAFEVYKIADPPFDCVFMDISMPVMDGFAATRAIRDFERSSGRTATQIIAMTGLGSAKARQEGLSSGMDIYLTKPVQLKKIQSLIQGMSNPSATGT